MSDLQHLERYVQVEIREFEWEFDMNPCRAAAKASASRMADHKKPSGEAGESFDSPTVTVLASPLCTIFLYDRSPSYEGAGWRQEGGVNVDVGMQIFLNALLPWRRAGRRVTRVWAKEAGQAATCPAEKGSVARTMKKVKSVQSSADSSRQTLQYEWYGGLWGQY